MFRPDTILVSTKITRMNRARRLRDTEMGPLNWNICRLPRDRCKRRWMKQLVIAVHLNLSLFFCEYGSSPILKRIKYKALR